MRFIRSISLAIIMALVFFMPISAHAFSINNPAGTGSTCTGTAATTAYCVDTANGGQNDIYGPHGLITDAITIISWVAGVVAVVVLMIGGFRFVISGGDPNQVSGARNMILYALVGLVVIGAAQIIMRFIIGTL